jgi:hypothetical protein
VGILHQPFKEISNSYKSIVKGDQASLDKFFYRKRSGKHISYSFFSKLVLSEQEHNNINEPQVTSIIVEQALQYAGTEAKDLIMQHIHDKYGLNFEFVGEYKTEFENYLRETLHESAEIIITKIRSITEDSKKLSATPYVYPSKRFSNSVYFMFCDRCFWTASLLTATFEQKCMSCGSEIKCALPISPGETFSYEISNKRGVTLSFS